MAHFLNQMIQVLNPECSLDFSFSMMSAMFKGLLKQGSFKNMTDLEVDLDLKVDSQSMKKAKKVMLDNASFGTETEKIHSLIISLFE